MTVAELAEKLQYIKSKKKMLTYYKLYESEQIVTIRNFDEDTKKIKLQSYP